VGESWNASGRQGWTSERYKILLLDADAAAVFSLEAPARVGEARAQGGGVKAAPEMERLQKMYVGTWDYTETYAKTAMSPDGGSGAGVYQRIGAGRKFHSEPIPSERERR